MPVWVGEEVEALSRHLKVEARPHLPTGETVRVVEKVAL